MPCRVRIAGRRDAHDLPKMAREVTLVSKADGQGDTRQWESGLEQRAATFDSQADLVRMRWDAGLLHKRA